MSLIAHYPLVKDTMDVFHYSYLYSSFTINPDAPLGGCLSTNKASLYTELDELKNKQVFSISFWIRFNSSNYVQRSGIFYFGTKKNSSGSSFRMEISSGTSSTSSTVSLNVFNNGFWTTSGGVGNITVPRNEWHFIAVSVSQDRIYFFYDGQLQYNVEKTNSTQQIFLDGRFGLNNKSLSFDIWNLKIFSHSISIKEEHKLYETCVLDYSFDNPLLNYQNLYSGRQYNMSNMTIQYDVETEVFKDYGFDTAIKFIPNSNTAAKLAYSYFVPTNVLSQNNLAGTTKLGFSFYAYASDDLDANITLTTEQNGTISKGYVSSDPLPDNRTTLLGSSSKGKVVLFHGIFNPNSSGLLYSMFYFNMNKPNVFTKGYVLVTGISIYPLNENDDYIEPNQIIGKSPVYGQLMDSSGFENHATSYPSNIVLSRDSPVGRYSWKTNNDGSSFDFTFPLRTTKTEGTIEFWIKLNSLNSYQTVFGLGTYGGSGIWLALCCEGSALWFYNGSYYRSTLSSSGFSLNEWHHVACTLSGATLTWFFDGKLINSVNNSSSKPNFYANSTLAHLGGYWTSSLSWNTKLDAYIGNFKIYARVLTEDEINNHFRVKTSFAKNGDIICNSITNHNDLTKSRISKGGELISQTISELNIFEMPLKILSDGSVWARIFHHLPESGTNLFAANENTNVREPGKFSLLYLLSSDTFKQNNNYEFLLEYPQNLPGQYNRRKQTSNPATSSTVSGYSPIHIDWTSHSWGGLMLNAATGGSTFIKGSTSSEWYYAIGCRSERSGSIPGPGSAVDDARLYIRIDNLDYLNNQFIQKIGKSFISGSNFTES